MIELEDSQPRPTTPVIILNRSLSNFHDNNLATPTSIVEEKI